MRWVAPASLHVGAAFADERGQFVRVVEHAGRFTVRVAVAAQGEHAGHLRLVEHGERLFGAVFGEVLGGQVRHGGDAVFGAHGVGDARGGGAVGAFAGAVGHGDEVRAQPGQSVERVVDRAYRRGAFGREHLQRENGHRRLSLLTNDMACGLGVLRLGPWTGMSDAPVHGPSWGHVVWCGHRRARTRRAASTMCSRLGQVSALPRVLRPQSGLIHTLSTSILSRISPMRSSISSVEGMRGLWMS